MKHKMVKAIWANPLHSPRHTTPDVFECETIGYLVESNAEAITLARSVVSNGKKYSEIMAIPARCIISVEPLRKGK